MAIPLGGGGRLPLPPFGRELLAARRHGLTPNLFIHAGDHAWSRARSRKPPTVLCLPPDESFEAYDWRCVRGLMPTLIVWNRPPDMVDAFARHLVQAGAELVAAIGAIHDGQRIGASPYTIYKPVPKRAVA